MFKRLAQFAVAKKVYDAWRDRGGRRRRRRFGFR
jgi:hypothetical protein